MDDDSRRPGDETDDAHESLDMWARYSESGGPYHAELARERFARIAAQPDAHVDLALAALLIAQEEYPDLDPARYITRLDDMAAAAKRRIEVNARSRTPDAQYIAVTLNRYLFDEIGLRGNKAEMGDPRNSFLNDVLERRTGLPITLSLVYMEVARRIGFATEGVGLPGHFIVRHPSSNPNATPAQTTGLHGLILNRLGYRNTTADPDIPPDPELLIDPFNAGALLSYDEIRRRLRELYGQSVPLRPEILAGVSNKQFLARMLGNLKGSYLRAASQTGADAATLLRKAVAVCERLLLVSPDAHGEYRDRGLLYLKLGSPGLALTDLNHYLFTTPEAEDAAAVRRQIASIRSMHYSPN